DTSMPTMVLEFSFEPTETGTRVTTVTRFDSNEDLDRLLQMGMVEGTTAAMEQIDAVVDAPAPAPGLGLTRIGSNRARLTRKIRGAPEMVWCAHTEAELLRRWQLGPDGWSMPVCEVTPTVDATNRTEWENDATGERFGFTGTVLEATPPYRL